MGYFWTGWKTGHFFAVDPAVDVSLGRHQPGVGPGLAPGWGLTRLPAGPGLARGRDSHHWLFAPGPLTVTPRGSPIRNVPFIYRYIDRRLPASLL